MAIQKVFVVGSGTMGNGIAQVCAQAGIQVFINDINRASLDQALKTIAWSVRKLIEKGRLAESLETVMARIHAGTEFAPPVDADIAIEAVFERLEVKQGIFKELDEMCDPNTLIASNTSAIPITELACVTRRPEKVLGLHFFNPVPLMEVVEVIRGIKTSEQTMQAALGFVKRLGKEAVRVESDVPGFLLNRINLVSYVEAIRLLEHGIGTVEDIDKGVKLAFGRKMGPFETGDLVGLDVSCGALNAIYEESQDLRYYPPQLLRRKVRARELGRKTGRGWYEYAQEASDTAK